MSAKTSSPKTFSVVTMNMRDGSVQGHAAGCADLKRGIKKFAEPSQAEYAETVETKAQAWENYNADFLAEGSGAYEIDWLPCAKHVPAGDQDAILASYEADHIAENAEEAETRMPVETTIKQCGKWTRFYQNGVEVGRVHNDAADAVFAVIRQG